MQSRVFFAIFALILFGTAVLTSAAHAQFDNIEFETLSLEHGLSQSSVLSIAQDEMGFMWFATEFGLNKYDGYKFIVLQHDPADPNTLSHTWIVSLFRDHSGILWIGTFNEGLNKYNLKTEEFTHYRSNPDDQSTLSNNIVRVIYEDHTGTLWIGTDNGLNRFDRETEEFARYFNKPDDPRSLSHNSVRSLCEDGSGALWIGTDGGGLNKFIREEEEFIRYMADQDNSNSLSNNSVKAICEDESGDLWIGTNGGGLNKFDIKKEYFIRYRHDPNDISSISHDEITSVYQDRTGMLWVGTNGGGINIFNEEEEEFVHYRHDANRPNSLCNDEVYSIYEDRAGVIWIGTYTGGISKYDRKKKKFSLYRRDPNDPNSLNADPVWSFYEDEDGMLWIGTHGGGLNRLDRRKNQYTYYTHHPNDPHSISHNVARIIHVDRDGMFWIGTHGGGLNRFDKNTGIFKSYQHDPNDPHSLSHQEIRWICEDRSGALWIGTNGGGLNKFDKNTERFIRYRADPNDPNSLSNDFARVVIEDSQGVLWIGTQGGGIDIFDRDSEKFAHLRADPEDPRSLSSDHILSIFEDRSGVIWIGTWGGGLNMYNRSDGTFTSYTVDDGLPSNAIYGMLEDDQGNLWLSTNNGLSRYDRRNKTFKNYNVKDGLQSNEFNGNSYYRSKSGEMFFGGVRGFNAFYPDRIRDNPYIPPIVITSFQKLNREAKLDVAITEIEKLVLSYKDYEFSFEFAALDYSVPEKNKYAYKMEGLDKDWIYTDASKRFASYTTLPPGNYVFRVKGSNNDDVWNEEGRSIAITITPPFWATWWFRSMILLALLGIILMAYRFSLRNTRMKVQLQAAHDAQMSIMPLSDPVIDGFEISGICMPANEVGGDFYDYIWLGEEKNKLGIVVGDVSGKAMKAAMIAIMSNGMVFSKADELRTVRDIMTRLNHSLYLKTEKFMFTALCLTSLDIEKREFTFSLAGFNEPLLTRGKTTETLQTPGIVFPLGAFEDSTYQDKTISLEDGDVITIYTDGISEAQTKQGEFYETEKLINLLNRTDTDAYSAKDIKDLIIDDVSSFHGSMQQDDDMTVVVIKCTAKAGKTTNPTPLR
jgi:serine phosphatase RsbU (regulator of sigma subunit)/ligand-binding sensor domain-containing protein